MLFPTRPVIQFEEPMLQWQKVDRLESLSYAANRPGLGSRNMYELQS
jgi:hypothetical protein